MFPTDEDTRIHKRARTLEKKAEIELTRRVSEVTNPDELLDLILEIATKKYRRGDRKVDFKIDVPTENFRTWASEKSVGSKDWDVTDRRLVKLELTRLIKQYLKRQLASGVFLQLSSTCVSGTRYSFHVTISIVRPS